MDNIIQVGIQTTGAEQAQTAANNAAQGIQNVGTAASETAGQTEKLGAATGETSSLLDRLILMAKEAGQALLGMGTNAAEAGAEVKESMVGAGEAVTTLAEKAKLAGGSFSAMGAAGGLGALLGIGAAAGLVAEALNSVMEKAEKMEHLAWVSGDSVEQIAELQAEAAKYGITLDNLGMTLTKIDQMVTKYREGDAETVKIVRELGIQHTDLVGVLGDLDKAWSAATDKEKFVSDVKKELGRNIYDLLVLFSAEKGHLEENMKGHEEYATAVKKLKEEKQSLNLIEAKMSEEWTSFAADAMPAVEGGLKILIALWKSLVEVVSGVTDIIIASFLTIADGLGGLIKAAYDAAHGNVGAAKADLENMVDNVKTSWKAAGSAIWDTADEANRAWHAVGETTKEVKGPEISTGSNKLGAPGTDPKAVEAAQKLQDQLAKNAEEAAQREFAATKAQAEEDLKTRKISADQYVTIITDAANKVYDVERTNLDRLIALHAKEPAEVAKLYGEMAKDADNDQKEQQEAARKAAEVKKKEAEEASKFAIEMAQFEAAAEEEQAKRSMKMFSEMWKPYIAAVADKMKADEVYALAKLEQDKKLLESEERLALMAAKYDPAKQAQIIAHHTAHIIKIDEEIKALNVRNAADGGPHEQENVAKAASKGDSTIAADSQKGADQTLKVWQQVQKEQNALFDRMSNKVSSAFTSWITGAESFHKSFGKMLQSMESTFIHSLIQMGLRWLEHLAMKQVAHTAAEATSTATTAAAAATRSGLEKDENLKSIFMDAKTAASNSFKAVSGIPYVGPVLAPIAAAAAFAGVMAFAAFEQGGIVGNQEQMAVLHPREMVLPAPISEGVQRMVQNGGGGAGSGDSHIHFHINAIDGKNAASFIHNNRESIAKSVNRSLRDGRQFQYA